MTKWYTAKGDDGKTTLHGQAIEKDSIVFDILGVLDELQTYLGVCKSTSPIELTELLINLQNNVFKIQAEVATKRQFIAIKNVQHLEECVDKYGAEIQINSFILTSSNSTSAHLDYARALARKAERAFYVYLKDVNTKGNSTSLKYLNRLSSLLFVLAKQYDTELTKVDYK